MEYTLTEKEWGELTNTLYKAQAIIAATENEATGDTANSGKVDVTSLLEAGADYIQQALDITDRATHQ